MIDPPPTPHTASLGRNRRRFLGVGIAALLMIGGGWAVLHHARQSRQWSRLLTTDSAVLIGDSRLTAFAITQAKPLYAARCASCHGQDLQGDRTHGAPNLRDTHWLYGEGTLLEIERTLLYGVRSGHGKSHDVTDMPAFGLTGRLSSAQIGQLVQYLLKLEGQPHEQAAAREGQALYFDVAKANCGDCHGDTARGNADYGAPDLTTDTWRTGDDAKEFFQAIYSGQHRIMPAWIGTLSLAQIRALAIFVYVRSHGAADE
jgi:cytochrome c oxidase cbb3-type subunit 3